MNTPVCAPLHLTRRQSLLLAIAGLAGCGGGSEWAALPGTGGTGIYAQGPITGFGSVIVNSVKYDDSSALVRIDGVAATSGDLRLGMVAEVQGTRSADGTQGTASQIDVWTVAQGMVETVTGTEVVVAGMRIAIDDSTVLDGLGSLAELQPGQPIAVWGLQAGADGQAWAATRLAYNDAFRSTTIATGLVGNGMMARSLNGLPMDGGPAMGLAPGQLVRVQGMLGDDRLRVDTARVLGLPSAASASAALELEGFVTALLAPGRFMLGAQEVNATAASVVLEGGPGLKIGQRVEVRGSLVGGVLQATQVNGKSDLKLQRAELDARIERFDNLGDFVLRGQRCDARRATFTRGSAADLKVGVRVRVEGVKGGNMLLVATIEVLG